MARGGTLPVNLGPFVWHNPVTGIAGSWTPCGAPRFALKFANPWQVIRGTLLSARLFVGLYVGGRPKWKKKDVIDHVAAGWGHEASFISQDGLWTDRGTLKPEKSVQIVILNVDDNGNPIHRTQRAFEVAIGKLAEGIRRSFQQKLVVVDIQSNGHTVGTGLATPPRPRGRRGGH